VKLIKKASLKVPHQLLLSVQKATSLPRSQMMGKSQVQQPASEHAGWQYAARSQCLHPEQQHTGKPQCHPITKLPLQMEDSIENTLPWAYTRLHSKPVLY